MKTLLTLGVMALMAANVPAMDEVIRPDTKIGVVDVGGLTRDDARKKLRVWWEQERRAPITLTSSLLKKQPDPRSATNWGLVINDIQSINGLPPEAFVDSENLDATDPSLKPISAALVLDFDGSKMESLRRFIADQAPPASAKKAYLSKGKLVVKDAVEIEYFIEEADMKEAVIDAFAQPDRAGKLPVQQKKSTVQGNSEGTPVEIIGTFSTHYPMGQKARNTNLNIASGKIDGTVLMPGEVFSFNKVVGKRTEAAGFQEAGVYVNGRHDTGIGGGCCQVSTTLYNTALLADMKIVERSNHSMPVAYVPKGRDATVSWGTYDFQFQNNKDYPVVVTRTAFGKGRLGFAIYGSKENFEVKLTSQVIKTWDNGTKYEVDRKLRTGQRVVTEKGSMGSTARAWRKVYIDGKLVRTDDLGLSTYRGGPRIISVGPGTPVASSSGKRRTSVARRPSNPLAPTVAIGPGRGSASGIVPQRRGG